MAACPALRSLQAERFLWMLPTFRRRKRPSSVGPTTRRSPSRHTPLKHTTRMCSRAGKSCVETRLLPVGANVHGIIRHPCLDHHLNLFKSGFDFDLNRKCRCFCYPHISAVPSVPFPKTNKGFSHLYRVPPTTVPTSGTE